MSKPRAKRATKQTASAWERGRLAGIAWIETDGAADCNDKEVAEQAHDLAGFEDSAEDRASYEAGFIAGVDSMTVKS